MNSFAFAIFAVALAVANAGVYAPLVSGTTLQGPSTRSAVVGPDGSSIVASAPGGVVSTSTNVGYAAQSVVAAPAVVSAPVVSAYSAPVVAAHGPVVSTYSAYGGPVLSAYSAPVVAARYGAPVVANSYGAPFVTAHGVVAKTLVASPLTASGYPLLAPGSGIEGQYVPDYTEKLYDDGSYKGEIY